MGHRDYISNVFKKLYNSREEVFTTDECVEEGSLQNSISSTIVIIGVTAFSVYGNRSLKLKIHECQKLTFTNFLFNVAQFNLL
jgi:hypothetical protein